MHISKNALDSMLIMIRHSSYVLQYLQTMQKGSRLPISLLYTRRCDGVQPAGLWAPSVEDLERIRQQEERELQMRTQELERKRIERERTAQNLAEALERKKKSEAARAAAVAEEKRPLHEKFVFSFGVHSGKSLVDLMKNKDSQSYITGFLLGVVQNTVSVKPTFSSACSCLASATHYFTLI